MNNEKMNRELLTKTSGRGFIQRFRNGLITLDEEVNKLETITANLDNKNNIHSYKTYFHEQTMLLNNLKHISNEVETVLKEVKTNIPNLDALENRLLNFRERLFEFENDPKLISRGYKPYQPKMDISSDENDAGDDDSGSTSQDDDVDEQEKIPENKNIEDKFSKMKTFHNFNNNNEIEDATDSPKKTTKEDSLIRQTIMASVKKSNKKQQPRSAVKKFSDQQTKIQMDNPMYARAFDLCNRWIKPENNDQTNCVDGNGVVDSSLDKKTPLSKKNRKYDEQSDLSEQMQQKLSFKNGTTPKTSLRNRFKIQQMEEYETVEFTPGMTTRTKKTKPKN